MRHRFDPLPFVGVASSSVADRTPFTLTPVVREEGDDPPAPLPAEIPDGFTLAPAAGIVHGAFFDPTAPLVFDYSGLLNHENIQLRLGHVPGRYGMIEKVWVDGPLLRVRGMVERLGKMRGWIVESSAAGFPWRLSIGTRFPEMEIVYIKEGDDVLINGLVFSGPLNHVKTWKLNEVSLGLAVVDIGASFRVLIEDSDTLNFPEMARVMTPEMAGDEPTFSDDSGRLWRLNASYEIGGVVGVATGIDLYIPTLEKLLIDRDRFRNVIYCLSVDATGRRCPESLEAFDLAFQTPATRTAALTAFLTALESYKRMIETPETKEPDHA